MDLTYDVDDTVRGQLILSSKSKISVSSYYIESGLQLEIVWYDYLVEIT